MGLSGAKVGSAARIEPYGFIKFLALGVEEHRVLAIIGFDDDRNASGSLGHGHRVEVRIIVWEEKDVSTIPASVLLEFKTNGQPM